MNNKNEYKIEISTKTIVFSILIIIGFFLAWELRIVFFIFFIAYIINATFRPAVDFLEKKRIPRVLSTILIFIVSFSIIALLLLTITTEAYNQLNNLFNQLPNIVFNVLTSINKSLPITSLIDAKAIQNNLKDIVSVLTKLDFSVYTNGISSAVGILSAAATFSIFVGMISVLSIYMLLRKDDAAARFLIFIDKKNEEMYLDVFKKIELKLGRWLRAQVLIMFSAGFLVWFGLSLPVLFIPSYTLNTYALPIALLVLIIELIPGFGIATGSVLTTIIALASGNIILVLFVLILFVIIQQIEGMLIVPKMMNKAIDLDPMVTILGFVGGSMLFGIIGAVLIIPILATLKILFTEYINRK